MMCCAQSAWVRLYVWHHCTQRRGPNHFARSLIDTMPPPRRGRDQSCSVRGRSRSRRRSRPPLRGNYQNYELKRIKDDNQRLRIELRETKDENSSLSAQLREAKDEHKRLQAELRDALDEVLHCKDRNAVLGDKNTDLNDENRHLETNLRYASDKACYSQKLVAKLRWQLSETNKSKHALVLEMDQLVRIANFDVFNIRRYCDGQGVLVLVVLVAGDMVLKVDNVRSFCFASHRYVVTKMKNSLSVAQIESIRQIAVVVMCVLEKTLHCPQWMMIPLQNAV